jgi:hypothetical protein
MGLQALPQEAEAKDVGLLGCWHPKYRKPSIQRASPCRFIRKEEAASTFKRSQGEDSLKEYRRDVERLFSVAGQMVSPLRTRLEASTIGVTQTLRSWVRNGLINAVDTLIDVSGEDANSIIWKADEDAGDAGD